MLYYLMLEESKMYIRNKHGQKISFQSIKKADEERIYLQPDIEDKIVIKNS